MIKANGATLPKDLRIDVEACGYFPEFVLDSVALALGDDLVIEHLVHHEATFDNSEIGRHLTVLALTPSRLIVSHTDDSPDPEGRTMQAITSTEVVSLSRISSVSLTRVISSADSYSRASAVESWLSLGWGTMTRLDIEPAHCGDPDCDADHGFTGSTTADDITIRMSQAADGAANLDRLVAFGTALQRLTGR